MKRISLSFLLLVGLLPPMHGAEGRIARFDVTRVFDGYKLTQDLQREAEASINQTGPQTDPVRTERAAREKLQRRLAELTAQSKEVTLKAPKGMYFHIEQETVTAALQLDDARRALGSELGNAADELKPDQLQQQIDGLEARIKQTGLDSPDVLDRLKLELKAATGRMRMREAQIAMERVERDLASWDETWRKRARILNEIWAMAAKLRAERGFSLLVPINGPDEDQFLTIIVSTDCEDVTDALLRRLNDEYAGKKAK